MAHVPRENNMEDNGDGMTRRELFGRAGKALGKAPAVAALIAFVHGTAEAAQTPKAPVGKVEYKKSGNARIAHANGHNADSVHTAIAAELETEITKELHGGDFVVTGFKATHGHGKSHFGMEYVVYVRPIVPGEKPHKFFTVRGTVLKSRAEIQAANAQKVHQVKQNVADPAHFTNTYNVDVGNLETNIRAVSHTNPGEKLHHEAVLILGRPR